MDLGCATSCNINNLVPNSGGENDLKEQERSYSAHLPSRCGYRYNIAVSAANLTHLFPLAVM